MSRIDAIWIGLLAATGVTFLVGETGHAAGVVPVLLVLGLAVAKGVAVALDFMELRSAPPLWRRLVLGWLIGVVALIVLARAAGRALA